MVKQNKDYGYEIQKLYLEMMLSDAETFVRCQSIFDYTLFDRKLQEAAEFMNMYTNVALLEATFLSNLLLSEVPLSYIV